MDKQEAIKRLDALEGEANKLREIIENGDTPKYDGSKFYVAIINKKPYVLLGRDIYSWYNCDCVVSTWAGEHKNGGQDAINYVTGVGKVYEFYDRFEGMKFFYDAYMASK